MDLRLANQAFAEPGLDLQEAYLATLSRDFGAPLAELAFGDPEAARAVINRWSAERTNNRIRDLFPAGSLTSQTRLVLANAISLDARWRYLFDPAQTSDGPFVLPDGSTTHVRRCTSTSTCRSPGRRSSRPSNCCTPAANYRWSCW